MKARSSGIVVLVSVALTACLSLLYLNGQGRRQPDIIVLLLDTTRADHLGAYGYARDTSPCMDRFARENTLYANAYSTAPWTPPSVATIFTGLYPSSHEIYPTEGCLGRRQTGGLEFPRIPWQLPTMARLLRDNGYDTAAVTPNHWIGKEMGFHHGFDSFVFRKNAIAETVNEEAIAALERLASVERRSPFFLYLHYFDPHWTYNPPRPYLAMFDERMPEDGYSEKARRSINGYDAELRYMDDYIQKLFVYLQSKDLYDSSMIVLVGDHGEQFEEHGQLGHGYQLFNEELRVPLIVKFPGHNPPRRVDTVVSTVDLLPTVLDAAGIQKLAYLPGVSLLDEDALAKRRGVLGEIQREFVQRAYINSKGKKLLVGTSKACSETEASDPTSHHIGVYDGLTPSREPLLPDDHQLIRELNSEMADVIQVALRNRIVNKPKGAVFSESAIRELKSLGYLR